MHTRTHELLSKACTGAGAGKDVSGGFFHTALTHFPAARLVLLLVVVVVVGGGGSGRHPPSPLPPQKRRQ